MKKIYVTIQGPVSSMKSPIAKAIKRGVEKSGLSCTIFDHELFTCDSHFQDSLSRVLVDAKSNDYDVSVVVIGTGKDEQLIVQVEPALPGASIIFKAITDGLSDSPI